METRDARRSIEGIVLYRMNQSVAAQGSVGLRWIVVVGLRYPPLPIRNGRGWIWKAPAPLPPKANFESLAGALAGEDKKN